MPNPRKPHRRWTNLSFIGLIVFMLAAVLAHAETPTRLAEFNRDTSTFQAGFVQSLIDPDGNLAQKSIGSFWLQRPGKFRWDYREPYEQVIVSDGTNLWLYDIDLEQVTKTPVDQALSSTPAVLLSTNASLDENFTVRELASRDGKDWVELVPRHKDTNFEKVILGFNRQGLSVMELEDSFQQKTRIEFTGVYINRALDSSMFNFVPPEGVDVIGN